MNGDVNEQKFVVFLDIMGFKDRVARSRHAELREDLTSFNRDILGIINGINGEEKNLPKAAEGASSSKFESKIGTNAPISIAQFSDSIVLFSSGKTNQDLKNIAEVTRQIMVSAINRPKPFPLKGALAFGDVTCNDTKSLFFGQALVDAYELQENVHYYGVVVHHSAEERVKDAKLDLFRDASVPLKGGKIGHYELVWNKEYEDLVSIGLEKLRFSVSDSPRRYIDNTIANFKPAGG